MCGRVRRIPPLGATTSLTRTRPYTRLSTGTVAHIRQFGEPPGPGAAEGNARVYSCFSPSSMHLRLRL
jgi:hypothetical protein